MRAHHLAAAALVGLLNVPAADIAFAIPAAGAPPSALAVPQHGSVEPVYYRRGVYYPYRHHGMYFHHHYYRDGRWHYY